MKILTYFKVLFLPISLWVGLVLVGGLSVLRSPLLDGDLNSKSIFDGDVSKRMEGVFDNSNVIKHFAINCWAAIQYVVFSEGKKGVVIGRDGWLFTSEEFYSDENFTRSLNNNLRAVRAIERIVSASGLELVILVVPAKADIYSEYLGRDKPSVSMSSVYRQASLRLENERTLYLNDLFEASVEPVFLKTDTHWSAQGAKIAAQYLSSKVMQLVDLTPYKKEFVIHKSKGEYIEGDLLRFVPVLPYFDFLVEEEFVPTFTTELISSADVLGEAGLFSDEVFPVVLVGTSYSANTRWNFLGQLKLALGVDVVNYAKEGVGPFEPMLDYLESDDFKEFPPEVVLWEFPERYLAMQYDFESRLLSLEKDNTFSDSVVNRELEP